MTMTAHKTPVFDRPNRSSDTDLQIALPQPDDSLSQDEEWCVVRIDDQWRQIRLHDYEAIYKVPGLYERVIYEILECQSPPTVCNLLMATIRRDNAAPNDLRVLDLGAGNGIVGARLKELGAGAVVGVDIIPEAEVAARRDWPDVYHAYHVCDMTRLDDKEREQFKSYDLNCLVCVAALGFADIPSEAFLQALSLINPGGWVAFNIKEEFLSDEDGSDFSKLIRSMCKDGSLEVRQQVRYQHRLGLNREPIYYVAIGGRLHREPNVS